MKKSNSTKSSDLVFEIQSEGGELAISCESSHAGIKYKHHHFESDLVDEGFGIDRHDLYDTFEETFLEIDRKHKWYMLRLKFVKEQFRNYIGKKLLEKLNVDMVLPQSLDFTRSYLEEALNNTLEYNENSKVKEDAWR